MFLWDDRIRIAFNYSGKGSAVDLALVMDAEAEALEGAGGFVHSPLASTIGGPDEPATIYFVGAVFVLSLPLPKKR